MGNMVWLYRCIRSIKQYEEIESTDNSCWEGAATMHSLSIYWWFLMLCFDRCFAHNTLVQHGVDRSRIKVLNVGKELTHEVLPLHMGYCLYELHGLKPSRWYEVKISYPASIPASFAIKLVKDNSTNLINLGRRLLNTEKLIFEADSILPEISGYSGICAFVSVQAAGVVAKSYLKEQHSVVYNIVCDELLYGIPHQAWWVGFLVVFCLLISCLIPNFLPPEFLPRKGSSKLLKRVL